MKKLFITQGVLSIPTALRFSDEHALKWVYFVS